MLVETCGLSGALDRWAPWTADLFPGPEDNPLLIVLHASYAQFK